MTRFMKCSPLALILAAGLTSPAFADVQVVGTVDVDKDITIIVETDKTKTVDINVNFDGQLDGAAKADAIVNATIDSVTIGPISDNVTDEGIDKTASTSRSVNRNTGIVQFNQDAGQTSNQGNVASVAAVFTNGDETQAVMSEAYADQRITNSSAVHREGFANLAGLVDVVDGQIVINRDGDYDYDLTASIAGSYNRNEGVIHGNQNVGNGNNQHNVLSLAVGDNALVALSDAGLGQQNSGNTLLDINTLKTSSVVNSMNGNTGIVMVNQAAGAFNNQATVMSVAAMTSTVGL